MKEHFKITIPDYKHPDLEICTQDLVKGSQFDIKRELYWHNSTVNTTDIKFKLDLDVMPIVEQHGEGVLIGFWDRQSLPVESLVHMIAALKAYFEQGYTVLETEDPYILFITAKE